MFKLNVSILALMVLGSFTGCSTTSIHASRSAHGSRSTASDSSEAAYGEMEMGKAKESESSHDFDQAIIHYEYALTDGAWAEEHPQQWMSSLRDVVSLAVHVKHNPSLAVELVSEVTASKSVPPSLTSELAAMKQGLKENLREDLKEDRIEQKAEGKATDSGVSPFNAE